MKPTKYRRLSCTFCSHCEVVDIHVPNSNTTFLESWCRPRQRIIFNYAPCWHFHFDKERWNAITKPKH